IDRDEIHMRRHCERNRREVQDTADSTRDEQVGDGLRCLGRNAQNCQLDLAHRNDLAQRIDRLDNQSIDLQTDLAGVVVEESDHMETARAETAVPQECPAKIPQAYQRERPIVVDSKDVPQRVDELFDGIADTRMPELTEVRKIFANLRILDRKWLA